METLDYKFNFEKLDVWQESVTFTYLIYEATKNFPKDEMFGLTSQMRRAVVSVSSNIAEGSVRLSSKDKVRFYDIAIASLMEVLNQSIIANGLGYLSQDDYSKMRGKVCQISRMLHALRKSQL